MQHSSGGIEKLLKLARHQTQRYRIDLVDLEKAIAASQQSLLELEQTLDREVSPDHETVDTLRFQEGMRTRRMHLRTTLMSLEKTADDVRARLEDSLMEIQKLDHLVAEKRVATAREDAGRDQRIQDDVAARTLRAER